MIKFNQVTAAEHLGMHRQYLGVLLKKDGNLGITGDDLMSWCLSRIDSINSEHRDKIAANDEIRANLRDLQRLMNR